VKILASPDNNLTVSADDDQSIYRFRGASYNNIIQFKKDFPNTKEVFLIKNYRSTQNILDLSYDFIKANNPNRLEYVSKINKKLKSVQVKEGTIEHMHFKDSYEETQGVINKIAEIVREGKDVSFSDFVILVRANDHATAFTRALERANFPYQFLASRGLYAKPIILDIISYFKLLDNYHESPALYRILNLPFLNISVQDIARINQYARRKTKSLYEALNELQLISGISLQYLLGRESKQQLDLVNQFHQKIKNFEEANIDPSLKNFMESLSMELESGEQGKLNFDPDQGPDMVRVMTIHSAKGLEFKYVFLVNLVDRRFPTSERREQIEIPKNLIKEMIPEGDVHLEEERRLCYVAMTRAKEKLFFTSADNYGGARKKKPSRFLMEMNFVKKDEELISITVGSAAVRKQKKETSEPLILPSYLSFSQLAAFAVCPLQYKFAHILKIPVRGKAVFSFGKTMHNTLYDFVKLTNEGKNIVQADLFASAVQAKQKQGKKVLDMSVLVEIYKKNWIDEWYESNSQKEEYYKLGLKKVFIRGLFKSSPEFSGLTEIWL
jgi:DNA helicase-2/ATP-dependent DNA helicase PcrA